MSPTIIVVDDELSIAESIAWLLQDEGYTVLTARDGEKGLERIRESRPALVITDLMMPIMDGATMCRRLQADPETRHIPIIAMTAVAQLVSAGSFEYAAYIAKPFDIDDLIATVARVLAQSRSDGAATESLDTPG